MQRQAKSLETKIKETRETLRNAVLHKQFRNDLCGRVEANRKFRNDLCGRIRADWNLTDDLRGHIKADTGLDSGAETGFGVDSWAGVQYAAQTNTMAAAITDSTEDRGTTSGTDSADTGELESAESDGLDGAGLGMPAARTEISCVRQTASQSPKPRNHLGILKCNVHDGRQHWCGLHDCWRLWCGVPECWRLWRGVAHKKYSHRFIILRLNHCSHVDGFNDVFNTFLDLKRCNVIAAYSCKKMYVNHLQNLWKCAKL